MRKKLFMYATHATLVNQESYTFIKRGFDVYTAAWATNTRSTYESTDQIVFDTRHPYKGTCDFLTDDEVAVLSKIDVNMVNAKFYPDVQELLLEKFDVLYVFQITPWLLLYAEEFLKQGKPVIFRTSGHPLTSWGTPHDISGLREYTQFNMLPTDVAEVVDGEDVYYIMASLHPELFDCDSRLDDSGKYMLSVGAASKDAELNIKEKMKPLVDWVLINKNRGFVSTSEVDKLFNSCYMFFDMTDSLQRYSVFEAILHGKAVLPLEDKSIHGFMSQPPGVEVDLEYWHNGFDDVEKLKFYLDNPGAVERVYQAQRLWLNRLLSKSEIAWDKFIGERL